MLAAITALYLSLGRGQNSKGILGEGSGARKAPNTPLTIQVIGKHVKVNKTQADVHCGYRSLYTLKSGGGQD